MRHFFLFFLRTKSKKDLLDPQLVLRIEKEWSEVTSLNLKKSIEIYPSIHVKNDEKEWFNILNKQQEHARSLDAKEEQVIMQKYDLTQKQWKVLKNNYFVKNAKELRKTDEWKKWKETLKK